MTLVRATLLTALVALLVLPATASAIVGGAATQRDWPWMAGMEYDYGDGHQFRCGASLVRPDVVLTAAHCTEDDDQQDLPVERFRFLFGTRSRSTGGERIRAARYVQHEQWDATATYDVALFKLDRPVTSGSPIALAGPAEAGNVQPGDEATIIGWGAQFFGDPSGSDALKEAQVPLRSDDECSLFNPGLQPDTEVCAGNLTGGEDTCQGDSGGPLMVPGAAGGFVQAAVVSYGVGCALPTQYGVYAEIYDEPLRSWVERNASALSSVPAGSTSGGTSGGTTSGGTTSGGSTGTTTTSGTPSFASTTTRRPRIVLPSRLVVRRGRATVLVRTSGVLRSLRVSLSRSRRTYASGRRSSLRSTRGRVVLRARRGVRATRYTLRLTARDAAGRTVRASRTVRVRR